MAGGPSGADEEEALTAAVLAARDAMAAEGLGLSASAMAVDVETAKETLSFMLKGGPLLWATGQKVNVNQMKKALRDAKKRTELIVEEVVVEPSREPTQRAIDANGGIMLENPFDTAAVECKVTGKGIVEAAVRHTAEFMIEACDATGTRKGGGGDAFFVAIRGASRVRARIIDYNDGTYKVEWKPPQSGTCA